MTVAPALAQEDDVGGEAEESEGDIDGLIQAQGTIGAVIILLGSIVLLMVCTEKLISYLARASLNMKMSLFALAILFTGFEFDDTILAFVFSAGELEGAALGTALGTGLAITGITLAGAAIVRPFPVDLPTDYLVIFAVSPLILVPFVLLGTLTFVHGIVLIGFFILSFAYVILRERQRDAPVFRNTEFGQEIEDIRTDGGVGRPNSLEEIPEDRLLGELADSGIVWLVLSSIALAGIVFAAMLLEGGSEAVIEGFGINQTVFGATFLTLILTFEDIMLTIEPIRRGFPEIGVGNVIGSVLFSVTGNVGVILLLSEISIDSSVLTLHLPAVIIVTALAAYFLYEGHLRRWHGFLLGGLYVAYWLIAIVVFGGVPIGN
ncbi:sodium:calcium antiporter [Natrinema soli]|uniref:Sodium:calcium antiporter n=1 Tax=Natrinema soli TaxID=1930624 RepID=A0ABD5SLV2_9EURY|nr:sodium:proton exchanger [Natrinema soli]